MTKCNHDDAIYVGSNEKYLVDPCVYKNVEMFTNVDVIISRCVNCGHVEISWRRTELTEQIDLEGADD